MLELNMRHLTTLFDVSSAELSEILTIAHQLKHLWYKGKRPPLLAGRVLALLFEKPSLRTRVSFEAGIIQLGGSAMFLGQEVGWQKREKTSDLLAQLDRGTGSIQLSFDYQWPVGLGASVPSDCRFNDDARIVR
jgi:ornithine carbamoyltransferase